MLRPALSRPRLVGALGAAGLAACGVAAAPASADGGHGAVYTQTNAAAGNAVQAFDRGRDGRLTFAGSFATGGLGAGTGLGSQGAVALSEDRDLLLAVDAGSDDVAAFRVTPRGLVLAGRVPSGGQRPVSVTVRDEIAYVLNAGGVPNVSGFRVDDGGDDDDDDGGGGAAIVPLAGSTEPLPAGAAGPAQVSFAPDGRRLVVTEKATDRVDSFPLDRRGRPDAPVVTASPGATPFGFGFTRRGVLIVSEAAASTVSSYLPGPAGTLRVVTASAPTNQGAACWVAVTGDGRFAYTANASTGSISGFAVGRDGSLRALDADGRTATAPAPGDEALSEDSRHLYVLNPRVGEITAYEVQRDGSLEALAGAAGLPAGVVGLAAS